MGFNDVCVHRFKFKMYIKKIYDSEIIRNLVQLRFSNLGAIKFA